MSGYDFSSLKSIAVVAHDAGAANLLAFWLKDEVDRSEWHKFLFYVAGPAEHIFRQLFPAAKYCAYDLQSMIKKSDLLLSGTGAGSSLEYDARHYARQQGITSIAIIDHWVNYPIRFERDGQRILPDEIWVCDAYAQEKALNCFPEVCVRQIENYYLNSLVERIRTLSNDEDTHNGIKNVLYLLEPIGNYWGTDSGEFDALEYFLQYLASLKAASEYKIILKPHPSEPTDKYKGYVGEYGKYSIEIAYDEELYSLIGWADWVVGCETFAMVVALSAGKDTFSTIPPWGKPCRLPYENIIQIRDIYEVL
ncbi:hypothetical protein ACMXYO_02570 [Neptuniibacter sp. QD37_6]|uniref:hypothetical protein n=1 Tax=Neptuniibacter sp. QD37_6 TaxID=3398210 RepID=UPI0039F5BE42